MNLQQATRRNHQPLALGVDEEDNVIDLLYADEAFLGARYKTIILFRFVIYEFPESQQDRVVDFIDNYIRCRLGPGGTWIELR